MCSHIMSTLSHCSVPFRNWCLYCPTILLLSETGVYHFTIPFRNWCVLFYRSVPFRNWCLYCPIVLSLSDTGVSIVPLFCSFQKLVSLSSHCSVPFRNWCPFGVGVKKQWEFWHFCASASWSGCSQNPPWNPHSRLVFCPLCVDG